MWSAKKFLQGKIQSTILTLERRKRIFFLKKEGGLKLNEFAIHSQKLEKKQNKPKERRKTDKQNKYRNRTEGKISYKYSKR